MPWRNAAARIVSPGATVNVWPLGSRRTSCPDFDSSGNLAGAAELALDERAAGAAPRDGFGRHVAAWKQEQRDGDEVGDDAREDEEERRDHDARAVGERIDGEAPLREAGGEARDEREAGLLEERHAREGGEHAPRDDPPAHRLEKPHQHEGLEEGETQ